MTKNSINVANQTEATPVSFASYVLPNGYYQILGILNVDVIHNNRYFITANGLPCGYISPNASGTNLSGYFEVTNGKLDLQFAANNDLNSANVMAVATKIG